MSKENSVVEIIIQDLIARYKELIIAIYGIGSFFDEEIPSSWKRKDIDIIVIVETLKPFPKVDWTEAKFLKRKIEGKEIWIGFNTLEGFQNKEIFEIQSFSNYEWSVLDIKYPQNSVLLFGQDIRNLLPNNKSLKFDFNDVLARGLYHLDKSLGERDPNDAKNEFSKAVFKISFYLCKFFNPNFKNTGILRIGEKLKETCREVKEIKEIEQFFEETIVFRTTGYYITKFEKLRDNFIKFVFFLLKNGILHKMMQFSELKNYLASSFSGFHHLIQLMNKFKTSNESDIRFTKQDQGLHSINIIGTVTKVGRMHSFTKTDGSKISYASFIVSDVIGVLRVVIWNDQVRIRLFNNKNFQRNSKVEIINGYLRKGYDDKIEIHIGDSSNVIVQEMPFSPAGSIKLEITKLDIMTRLKYLNINETTISKTPCHHCGGLCSPSAKICPKCGEPLTFRF
ncbi:MAG: hypothetical protein ACFFA3_07840 [Promethearchaeota archaeon]